MCQLLGVSSNKPVNIQFSLKEFKERGRKNPHGFGFVFYENKEPKLIKEPEPLASKDLKKDEFKFKSKIIIGHVRLASCGNQSHENTHPFVINNWSFAHNGTVTKIKEWTLKKFKPKGETDSEHAFCYLLEKINNETDVQKIADILRKEAFKIQKLGKFNFLLSDGEYLYAFGDDSLYFTIRKAPFKEVILKDTGYCCHLKEIKNPDEMAALIATAPLTKEGEQWKKFEGLQIFKDGEIYSL
ncbi:MAG: class II glutamine amidotransferase [candidate division WOR-3 bacterium]